jgi:hypothetical protein
MNYVILNYSNFLLKFISLFVKYLGNMISRKVG